MGWDSDSEHSSDDEEPTTNTTSFVLIVLDCDELMFEKDEGNEESTFKTVLKSCYEIMDNMLMKGGKRGLCPIAMAVVSDDNDNTFISDFKDHLPTTVKKLRELCEMSDNDLQAKYKRKSTLPLSSFLLQCKVKLNTCGQEHPKYITYITKDDNPIGDDDNDRRLCVNQAKSFKDFNIYIELVTFNDSFAYEIFFQEILEAANSKFNYEYFLDMIGFKEKLVSLISYRGSRVLFFPFPGKRNFFEVIEKCYIKQHKILNNVIVTKDTNAEVRRINKVEYTGNYSVKFSDGEDPITLTSAERDAWVSDDVLVGFSLLGTYEGNMVTLGMHNTDPRFIQRNKRRNCPHFDIFWQYCVDRNRALICARKYRKSGHTKLVQLTPKVVNNIRSFLVLGIPCSEDIKYQDIDNAMYKSKATDDDEIRKAAENLVIGLDFQYDPLKIHDTVTLKKWEYIRSELLEEKKRDVPDILELKVVEKDASEVVEAFKKLTPVTGLKRKVPVKARASKKK